MADQIIQVEDLVSKDALLETFTEAAATALAIFYLAGQALLQVCGFWGLQAVLWVTVLCCSSRSMPGSLADPSPSPLIAIHSTAVLQEPLCRKPGPQHL